MSLPYDPVPADVTELIAKGKPAYAHEVRAMARELIELRERLNKPAPQFDIWSLAP